VTLSFGFLPAIVCADSPSPVFAKALAPGDTIMFVAPAKYLDEERILLAKKRLEEMGFKVRMPENLFRKHGFLGGSDDERASELMRAFTDPDVDAVFKILIGFSDITGLHIAINQRTGLVTFHSPVPEYGLGSDNNLSPLAAKWFWRALLANKYRDPVGDGLRRGSTIETRPRDGDKSGDAEVFADVPPAVAITKGKSRGRLIGGNLSVLHALMGTPYEIDTDGKILFLEDVGEAPYRVDRMLSTLRLAGKFDKVSGVVLGAFTAREGESKWDDDASTSDVFRDYFADMGVPVLANFPAGHVRYNTTLPIGALVELDAEEQTLRVLENPVRVE
jgi:muramoyltetrapeptide carboxypeptidase